MNKAPAFQFYAQDFLTGCAYLTNEEIGMYVKMLCKQWTDGKIPIKRLEFLIGRTFENLSEELREKFVLENGFLFNIRLEKEREKQKEKSEKAQISANKRWAKPTKTKAKKQPMRTHKNSICESDAFLEDRSMKNEDENNEKGVVGEKTFPEEFEPIWNDWLEYRKAKKKKAYAGLKWEQQAIDKLVELSAGNPETAKLILKQTTENNWEGFFPLKHELNGKSNNPAGKQQFRFSTDEAIETITGSSAGGLPKN